MEQKFMVTIFVFRQFPEILETATHHWKFPDMKIEILSSMKIAPQLRTDS